MSTKTVSKGNDPVIESRSQLISAFAKGEKPAERWRIGTEHEKFVYRNADHRAPGYADPDGIRALGAVLMEVYTGGIYAADAPRPDAGDTERS